MQEAAAAAVAQRCHLWNFKQASSPKDPRLPRVLPGVWQPLPPPRGMLLYPTELPLRPHFRHMLLPAVLSLLSRHAASCCGRGAWGRVAASPPKLVWQRVRSRGSPAVIGASMISSWLTSSFRVFPDERRWLPPSLIAFLQLCCPVFRRDEKPGALARKPLRYLMTCSVRR
jgi:hypothetical protein